MDWIKKNPAQLTLAIAAALAITATVLLWLKISNFDSTFDAGRGGSISNAAVKPLDTEALDTARKAIEAPVKWEWDAAPKAESPKLFISKLYVLHDGRLEKTIGKMFHPPVPNDWLAKYGFNVLNATVLHEDPDGDGFDNLEEFLGLDGLSHLDMSGQPVMGADGKPLPDDSTNPKDPNSHPPYHTKLELAKVVYIPFRLQFMSYDVNPKKKEDITVAINTKDRGGRTHYKSVGEDIPGTNFKIESFMQKEIDGADGTKTDVSEVTVKNRETGDTVVLPLKKEVDSPDSYGIFRYKWVKPGGQKTPDFPKRRGETFTLPPETDKIYKLIKIQGQDAEIELPGGIKKILTPPR